jgi:excisionase family DNA binding protein
VSRRPIRDLASHDEVHVSVRQVAEYFDVTDKTVWKWIDAGLLEAFAFSGGRVVRVSIQTLRRFEREHFRKGD